MTHPTPGRTAPPFIHLNAVGGSLVVGIGFWLIWREWLAVTLVLLAVALFLVRVGRSIARVWAWATLLVGVDSFAWPIVTMIRVHLETGEPTDQQMVEILNALLFGLFFAIFWASFSYGLFNWARRQETGSGPAGAPQDRTGRTG